MGGNCNSFNLTGPCQKLKKSWNDPFRSFVAFLFESICASGVKEKMGLIWTKEQQTEGFSVEAAVN